MLTVIMVGGPSWDVWGPGDATCSCRWGPESVSSFMVWLRRASFCSENIIEMKYTYMYEYIMYMPYSLF